LHLSKIRLSGFKSFLEPTELLIEPGITGIVGPNGCGKSNVIESLRWVMGETSAKKMRGGEMDDVIFGGTAGRPSRNLAEVSLHLDNADRQAPSAYNEFEELVITRHIDRGQGSTYKINGREVRARDVQLLFADLSTGAHSTAIVGQGRISALIGAKPTERRTLLEEAAGIRGLHSRRHEAELRLKGAETNLERLDDVIGALEGQFQGLQRQARQAARYRRISEQLRVQEAILLHLRWIEASATLDAARERLEQAERLVAQRTEAAASAARNQADKTTVLPDLRQSEAQAAAELQRLLVAQRELENEEARVEKARAEIAERLDQIESDIGREQNLAGDAAEALARLETEARDIAAAREGEAEAIEAARTAYAAVTAEVEDREGRLTSMTEKVAAIEAERTALNHRISAARNRTERLETQLGELSQRKESLSGEAVADTELEKARTEADDAEATVETSRRALEESEAASLVARESEAEAREQAETARSQCTKVGAEAEALAQVLEPAEGDLFAPLIDAVRVQPGYEAALGIALGEDLEASLDLNAPRHWVELSPFTKAQDLPAGVRPLSDFVKAPASLDRALSHVGVVDTAADARMMRQMLSPGQSLVSRDGGLCRWDGYSVAPDAPTAATTRLAQRNRLRELRNELEALTRTVEAADAAYATARHAAADAAENERVARWNSQAAFARLNEARDALGRLSGQAEAGKTKRAAVDENLERLAADLNEARADLSEAEGGLAGLADVAQEREHINRIRAELSELRSVQVERRTAYDGLAREGEMRSQRMSAIEGEARSWKEQVAGAEQRMADLRTREESARQEQLRLEARPAEIEGARNKLLEAISQAEEGRRRAADALAGAEQDQTSADRTLRESESSLAEAREARVRCEADLEHAGQQVADAAERIREKLDCAPERVLEQAGLEAGNEFPPREEVEVKLERLTRERDNMGPVNLRAEQESAELQEQIDSMVTEREDLVAAFNRLRQGINTLNREGRERLLVAFEEVNTHFEELFVRLFGGGRAHLTLTESDDPLEAGLEIMASPPGKRMQVMSLLSGGEQALTALALLFAVFLTNPAPICVLDEVDAPLDDANVDRFCTLLDEIAHAGTTRFLVVTHHRMTMARVDRLYGVTMAERGVSQLVSVDLRQAEELRQTA